MPKIAYKARKFSEDSALKIRLANDILAEYAAQGYDLTLRQLFYQFVSRGLIANNDREYKKLGSVVNDARLAGKIDWNQIVDRTRFLRTVSSWGSPSSIMRGAAASYKRDLWSDQDYRVEVWIEKDALVGVIERACADLRVPFLSCRGYTSQSEMWGAAQRFYAHTLAGQRVKVLHLGDHDPSGIDMSRDIEERILMFMAMDYFREGDIDPDDAVDWASEWFSLDRLALNWDQVQQYDPPPNPAKLTDSRGAGYVEEFGYESWELDALEPTVIGNLIQDAVYAVRDIGRWKPAHEQEERERNTLEAAADIWPEVAEFVQEQIG